MASFIIFNTPVLSNTVSPLTKAVVEVYNLSSETSMETISQNESNLKSLDIMLKYKITDKKTVEKLVEQNKLSSIDNIDSVLNKY